MSSVRRDWQPEDKVHAYAELYDLELLEVIVDAGESAKSLDRPGLKRALGMLKTGEADALLAAPFEAANVVLRSVPSRDASIAACNPARSGV